MMKPLQRSFIYLGMLAVLALLVPLLLARPPLVHAAATSITLVAIPNPVTTGSNFSLVAIVEGPSPGNVTFDLDPNQTGDEQTVPVAGGVATANYDGTTYATAPTTYLASATVDGLTDIVVVDVVDSVPTGTVTISKTTEPTGGTGFPFLSTSATNSSFTLDDGGSQSITDVPVGAEFLVTEQSTSGWNLTDITCTITGNNTFLQTGNDYVRIVLGENASGTPDSVDCTFTNSQQSTLEVVKNVVPSTDTGTFDLLIDGTAEATGVGNGQSTSAQTVSPGTHTVSEEGNTATLSDYVTTLTCSESGTPLSGLNNITVADPTQAIDVPVSEGQDIVCTFTNTRKGTLEVVKELDPTSDTGTFNLLIDGNTLATGVGNTGTTGAQSVSPGTYTVSETAGTGTSLSDYDTDISCDDGTSGTGVTSLDVAVGAGENVVCTITNTRKTGTLEVVKALDPTTDGGNFNLSIDGVTTANDQGHNGTTNAQTVNTGSYTVSEAEGTVTSLADYTSSLTCIDTNDSNNVVLGPTDTTSASVDVTDGSAIVCTFTNTRKGSLEVVKALDPTTDGGNFNLLIDGTAQATDVGNGGTTGAQSVDPGTHTVSETAGTDTNLANYTTDISCDDGTSDTGVTSLDVDVGVGENVVCTITNTKITTLTIDKVTEPSGDPQTFGFTSSGPETLTIPALSDADTPWTSGDISAGSYTVAEDAVTDWNVTAISCQDGTGTDVSTATDLANGEITFDVATGDNITCTFTNQKQGQVTIEKVIEPSDGGISGTFNSTALGLTNETIAGGSTSGPYTVDPGTTIDITEDTSALPAGWVLTGISCTDDGSGAAVSTTDIAGGDGVEFSVSAGQNVTCSFTNQEQSEIVIIKDAQPDSDTAFPFTASGPSDLGTIPNLIDDGTGTQNQTTPYTGLTPGSYTITEGEVAGWAVQNITCFSTDGTSTTTTTDLTNRSITFDLAAGDRMTCTFTNEEQSVINIQKNITTSGTASPAFGFFFGADLTSFSLSNGDTESFTRPAGSYQVLEDVPTGWELASITCERDGTAFSPTEQTDSNGNLIGVTLDPASGETIDCIFNNAELPGSITIRRESDANDTGYQFSGDLGTFTLDDGQEQTFSDLISGDYTISQQPRGDEPVSVICSGNTNSTINTGTASVTVGLAPGEDVTCTFSNQPPGSISVTKVVEWNGVEVDPNQTFTICIAGPSANSCEEFGAEGGSFTWENLSAGSYTVSENDPGTDWTVEGETTVELAIGANESVTITNTRRAAPTGNLVYLPFVARAAIQLPDLVITDFSLNPSNPAAGEDVVVSVTIENQGNVATTNGFWIDLFIDPDTEPTAATVPMQWIESRFCGSKDPCLGIAWGIAVDTPLEPGQSLTVTSADLGANVIGDRFSRWNGTLPSGTSAIYAYVDPWKVGSSLGSVEEIDETNNRAQLLNLGITGTDTAFPQADKVIPPRPSDPADAR